MHNQLGHAPTHHYVATTRGVEVQVEPEFLPEESFPGEHRFVWAYHVRIVNTGTEDVQLLGRHWKITDSSGITHEVVGDGVVGQQPRLLPGDEFSYSSGTPLGTPSGIMSGSYRMQGAGGELFEVEIPAFSLDSPYDGAALN